MADDVTLPAATGTYAARANDKGGKLIQVVNIDVGADGVASIPAGAVPLRFALGLGIAITGAVADSDTTAIAAGQVKVKLSRTV